ncbi:MULTISPECIES: hypothetical protein [Raoultella]|uniref:hypothetical protein n=1 Tax=Raoultella TaxID=160674 RepID=UPI002167FEE5|nr:MULTISPECIES: hypothetical protein [Raoultella]MCS4272469.1 hypothetical protein [Raoultella sp. BIGb0132]MCS4289194.1 hypothetical protein [Raoultella terrigena]
MLEDVYNLFYFASSDDRITHVGIVAHKVNGTDEEKINHLKKHIYSDVAICEHYDVDPSALGEEQFLSNSRFSAMARVGNPLIVFDTALQAKNASRNPLVIYTAIKNGQVQIDASIPADKEVRISDFTANSVPGVKEMPDYLDKYFVNGVLKFKELLVDDHVKPIHLLFKNKHYLSSIKLLMSFIDTIGYLEFGGVNKAFPKWLDRYCDLTSLEITSGELYELRHSLLHMTNLNSRKVMQGDERRISYSIAPQGTPTRTHSGITFFNYVDFIPLFEEGMNKWIATYDSEKLTTFVERYDQILRENY